VHLIFVKFRIKAEHLAEFKTEIARHIDYTRKNEPGCAQFDIATDKEDPQTFYLVEMYRDDKALTDHRASASLPIFRPKIEQWAEIREAKMGNVWADIKA
jgi:quinol monooxygenase YgiN